MYKFFRLLSPNFLVCRSSRAPSCFQGHLRSYADTSPTDLTTNKQVVIHGTENEQRVRVRRARSSDVPRVLRFVREHSRETWPSLASTSIAPTAASQLVLTDYVARALAQGHSMMAEQIVSRRGWLTVRGLALSSAVCPWDAHVLDTWAKCMRDKHSRRLVNFAAHCLRGPALHDKYDVHKILQVILVLSPDTQNDLQIVQMLAKSAIQRGKDIGFPLLRFDVTNDVVAKALEDLNMKKEWQLSYDVLSTELIGEGNSIPEASSVEKIEPDIKSVKQGSKGHFIAVYTTDSAEEPETTPATDNAADNQTTTAPKPLA